MFAREHIDYQALDLPDRMEVTDDMMLAEAQAFYDTMKRRHTVRDYSDRPVAREVIEECIRTAGTAPSGSNHQPWHFVAISNPAIKKLVRNQAEEEEHKFYEGAAGDEWLRALEPIGTNEDKPIMIVAVGHPREDAKVPKVAKLEKTARRNFDDCRIVSQFYQFANSERRHLPSSDHSRLSNTHLLKLGGSVTFPTGA